MYDISVNQVKQAIQERLDAAQIESKLEQLNESIDNPDIVLHGIPVNRKDTVTRSSLYVPSVVFEVPKIGWKLFYEEQGHIAHIYVLSNVNAKGIIPLVVFDYNKVVLYKHIYNKQDLQDILRLLNNILGGVELSINEDYHDPEKLFSSVSEYLEKFPRKGISVIENDRIFALKKRKDSVEDVLLIRRNNTNFVDRSFLLLSDFIRKTLFLLVTY